MTIPFFLKRAIHQKAQKQAEQKLRCFSDSKKIVILTSEKLEEVQVNMKWLAQTYPHFENIQLFNFSKDKTALSQNFQNVSMKEVNHRNFTFFGDLKKEHSNELLSKDYDLLINADSSSSLFLHLLASSLKADFKTGISDEVCKNLYKIKVYAQQEIGFKEYIEQTSNYLEALCGKGNT
ncbi:MAG: hypothetical protein KG029_20000 [Bacteroidetes bacterium]|jgi:hypothetical protein|nr:hypothetical protein [Bacteroidota bacterium]